MSDIELERLTEITEITTDALPDQRISDSAIHPIDKSLIPAEGISFYVMRLASAITVRGNKEFFIGRDVDEDIWKPLVDLAELDGYAMGVSRRHALIRPTKNGYEVIDLFSTNGTWLIPSANAAYVMC